MILAGILFAIIVLFLGLLIVFLNLVFLPSVKKQTGKEENEDPLISYTERNYIVPERKEFDVSDKRALVLCSCNKSFKMPQTSFNSSYTCFMIKSVHGSGTDCKYACIGLGDCAKVCPQQAISITNNTAVISEMCCGCGKCIDVCPQSIIKLVPKNTATVACMGTNYEDPVNSCSKKNVIEKVNWSGKKDFKIWETCYKLLNKVKKIFN